MKNVYIYNKALELIATPYITNEEEFIEHPKRFYPDYLEEHYYSFTKLINPVIENGEIREMTRAERVGAGQEELQEGEYFEGNEVKIKEKPSEFHDWNSQKNEWIHDKEKEISVLNNELEGIDKERFLREQTLKEAEAQNRKFVIGGLKKEIAELTSDYDEKYARYEELTGEEEK